MQIVINIPKDTYKNIMKKDTLFDEYSTGSILSKIIQNGTVLPKYEKHIDHTDCIYYPEHTKVATCSQYRDGWNDAMDYVFRNGKGYQPYRS